MNMYISFFSTQREKHVFEISIFSNINPFNKMFDPSFQYFQRPELKFDPD